MPIADTSITLGQEGVPGYIVFIYVGLDLGERPSEERIEFEHASGVYFEGLESSPIGALGGTTSGDDRTDVVFFVCSRSRFDLRER